ncbi:MAG: DUF4333 domain-containing protein [Microthrixaceae bacterium]
MRTLVLWVTAALAVIPVACSTDSGGSGDSGASESSGGDTGAEAVVLDPQRSATEVARSLFDATGVEPDSVLCPEGIDTDPAAASRCELTDGTGIYGVTVSVLSLEDDAVSLEVVVDEQPSG